MPNRTSVWSLRSRVVVISAFALITSLLVGGVAMYWAASIQEDQMLDARLEHLGATVLSFVEEELGETDASGAMKYHNLVKTRSTAALLYRYQVWSRDGALLLRSHEASSSTPLMSLSRLGFDTVQFQGEEYRTFSLPTKNQAFVIQVAENIDERWTQTGLTTAYYVGFLLVPFGLVFGVTWVLLRRSLSSIDAMADQLSHRNPLDLTALQVDSPPQELLPILNSIDTLFDRVGHAILAERKFTAVAAHEMRTPLAGLRAQAQIAGKAQSPEELQDAQKALLLGVDRASHMLDQLLDLARIESLPQGSELRLEWADLSDTYQEVMRDLGPKGARKQLVFVAKFPAEVLHCHAFALYVLMRNLIANAILYTPVNGRVEVSCVRHEDSAVLTVDDSGPGIAAHQREQAFERFNRLGQTQSEGVGLGLSIALSVIELHHAKIHLLTSPLGGLRLQMVFAQTAQRPQAVVISAFSAA